MLRGQGLSGLGAGRMIVVMMFALGLSACGSRGSEPAQSASNDLGLEQCELVDGTVLGEPTDPIMVDGVETQACRITAGQIPGGTQVDLKNTHEYQPLAWVLDGRLEIGESRTYATLDEFVNGEFARLTITDDQVLRATAGSVIIVHRNGFFDGDVVSEDENLEGSGEWGGVVVNSIGSHPNCASATSASNFCNIEATYGYYGGLSAADAQTEVIGSTIDTADPTTAFQLGFQGSVSEAGGAIDAAEALAAAVVLNAPLSRSSNGDISAFDTAGTGIEINGGYSGRGLRLVTQNTQGPAVYWHNDFGGGFPGVFYHSEPDQPALHGVGGDVDLTDVTLIDRDFTGGTAISVQGGHVDLTNVLVQNFRACLQLDASAGATLTGVAFGCLEPTAAAEDGTDYAASVTAAALENANSVYYEASPDLTMDLRVGNSELSSAYADWAATSQSAGGRDIFGTTTSPIDDYDLHDLRLIYPDCLGVGTLLAEAQTVTVGRTSYRICELSGTIDNNARLSGNFNDGYFAWVLDGEVSFGTDFASLSEAEQLTALESPGYLAIAAGTPVYARAGARLTVQPGIQWIVDGNADNPVEIAALPSDDTAPWGGVRVNGVDSAGCQSGSTTGLCAYAGSKRLSLEYLRVMQAGNGQAALQLYEVGPGATIDHLEIAESAGTGLELNGGRANLDHLLLTNNAGDQLLWQQGYRGTIQYGLFTSGATSTGQVLHGRNDSSDHDASPRSRPTLANLTMAGQGAGSAILLEQGSGLLLYNSIVSDFVTCLDIDDAATAALQLSTPQEIAMIDVVLSCEATLAAEAEDAGFDYGYAVAHSSSVYEVDPQLDENYVATSSDLPATAGSLDLSLAGNAAEYLDSDASYWGAVEDADDGWYLGWSDLGALLSAECDGKGVLVTDDYPYPFWRGTPLQEDYGNGTEVTFNYKICRLQSQLSEDLELIRYTGEDAEIDADGNVTVTESGSKYGLSGEVTWTHPAVPTIWLLDGIVTVGDGGRELADPAEAELLKADRVELTMRPGTWITATETGGLHVTRGGRLRILGEPMLMEEFCSYDGLANGYCSEFATTGPVSMFGLPLSSGEGMLPFADYFNWRGDYAPYAPLGNLSWNSSSNYSNDYTLYNTSAWQGITVDGFARNNQCTDAATAESGSRVCNIAGTLGYHGGYDDGYENLEVHNLYMAGGLLQLNSVAGEIDGLRYQPPNSFLSEQTGEASVVSLDGGRVNIRELLIELVDGYGNEYYNSAKPGSLIRWNHGYRGSLQHVYGFTTSVEDGQESRLQANGRDYFVPLIRGANGDAGHEDDLPRSMPTIANLSLVTRESPTSDIDSSAIELVGGSGLYLYHAVIGFDEDNAYLDPASDYCFKLDASVADRVLAGEFVVSQLAANCLSLSDNAAVPVETMTGVSNGYVDSGAAVFSSLWSGAGAEQAYVDPYSSGADPLPVRVDYNRRYPVQAVVDDYGHVELDVSSSPPADTEFLEATDYLGTLDYWNRP